MRRLLFIALAMVLLFGATSCKSKLDKTKLAGLAFDFVTQQVSSLSSSGEFDTSNLSELSSTLALEFIDAYSDEFPDRYREEVRGFLTLIIPMLIEDYLPGKSTSGVMPLTSVSRDDAINMIVEEWNNYEGG